MGLGTAFHRHRQGNFVFPHPVQAIQIDGKVVLTRFALQGAGGGENRFVEMDIAAVPGVEVERGKPGLPLVRDGNDGEGVLLAPPNVCRRWIFRPGGLVQFAVRDIHQVLEPAQIGRRRGGFAGSQQGKPAGVAEGRDRHRRRASARPSLVVGHLDPWLEGIPGIGQRAVPRQRKTGVVALPRLDRNPWSSQFIIVCLHHGLNALTLPCCCSAQ